MANKHPAPEARPHPSMAPVILANLTDQDHDRFHAAHIGYSGATGKGRVQGYEPYGPYIATFWGELEQALVALQWTRMEIHVEAGPQYIVRRGAVPSEARPQPAAPRQHPPLPLYDGRTLDIVLEEFVGRIMVAGSDADYTRIGEDIETVAGRLWLYDQIGAEGEPKELPAEAAGVRPQPAGSAKSLLPFASTEAKAQGCVCRPLGPTNRWCPVHDSKEQG